jgi:ATP phosphoribosyltransferase
MRYTKALQLASEYRNTKNDFFKSEALRQQIVSLVGKREYDRRSDTSRTILPIGIRVEMGDFSL